MAKASKGLEKPFWTGQNYCLINYDKAVEVKYNKGRWFVNMPVEIDIPEHRNSGKVMALDPGLRCFLTGFDGNSFAEFAKHDLGRIVRAENSCSPQIWGDGGAVSPVLIIC